ncbi:hypothetical protein DFP93_12736 [Aneurinibacillus soli]|nr:hypothetical protein DFP93_12736 [Aneurinibacillus soli]
MMSIRAMYRLKELRNKEKPQFRTSFIHGLSTDYTCINTYGVRLFILEMRRMHFWNGHCFLQPTVWAARDVHAFMMQLIEVSVRHGHVSPFVIRTVRTVERLEFSCVFHSMSTGRAMRIEMRKTVANGTHGQLNSSFLHQND